MSIGRFGRDTSSCGGSFAIFSRMKGSHISQDASLLTLPHATTTAFSFAQTPPIVRSGALAGGCVQVDPVSCLRSADSLPPLHPCIDPSVLRHPTSDRRPLVCSLQPHVYRLPRSSSQSVVRGLWSLVLGPHPHLRPRNSSIKRRMPSRISNNSFRASAIIVSGSSFLGATASSPAWDLCK